MDDLVVGVTPSQSCWATIQYGAKSSRTMDYSDYDHYPPEAHFRQRSAGLPATMP